jgi:hypothetical protein
MTSCTVPASHKKSDIINNKITVEDLEEDIVVRDKSTNTTPVSKKITKWVVKFLKNHSWILGDIGFCDNDG